MARVKHKNADSLSKKTECYERQEQIESDRIDIKDGFSFMGKETYDSLPLTRWLDKSEKTIEDHPDLPTEHQVTTIVERQSGIPVETLLKSKVARETLRAKSYDLEEVEKGKAIVGQDLMRLLQKLAHNKPVDTTKRDVEPEYTKLSRIV